MIDHQAYISLSLCVFKEERFAFSRDTRDDTVFASLADKITQVGGETVSAIAFNEV